MQYSRSKMDEKSKTFYSKIALDRMTLIPNFIGNKDEYSLNLALLPAPFSYHALVSDRDCPSFPSKRDPAPYRHRRRHLRVPHGHDPYHDPAGHGLLPLGA